MIKDGLNDIKIVQIVYPGYDEVIFLCFTKYISICIQNSVHR
jgi:hypothetical protein